MGRGDLNPKRLYWTRQKKILIELQDCWPFFFVFIGAYLWEKGETNSRD